MNWPPFDISLFVNTLFVGAVGGLFGALLQYYLQKRRDEEAWQKRKEELQLQFDNQLKLLQLEQEQKISELQFQQEKENRIAIRQILLKDIDRVSEAIKDMDVTRTLLTPDKPKIELSSKDFRLNINIKINRRNLFRGTVMLGSIFALLILFIEKIVPFFISFLR